MAQPHVPRCTLYNNPDNRSLRADFCPVIQDPGIHPDFRQAHAQKHEEATPPARTPFNTSAASYKGKEPAASGDQAVPPQGGCNDLSFAYNAKQGRVPSANMYAELDPRKTVRGQYMLALLEHKSTGKLGTTAFMSNRKYHMNGESFRLAEGVPFTAEDLHDCFENDREAFEKWLGRITASRFHDYLKKFATAGTEKALKDGLASSAAVEIYQRAAARRTRRTLALEQPTQVSPAPSTNSQYARLLRNVTPRGQYLLAILENSRASESLPTSIAQRVAFTSATPFSLRDLQILYASDEHRPRIGKLVGGSSFNSVSAGFAAIARDGETYKSGAPGSSAHNIMELYKLVLANLPARARSRPRSSTDIRGGPESVRRMTPRSHSHSPAGSPTMSGAPSAARSRRQQLSNEQGTKRGRSRTTSSDSDSRRASRGGKNGKNSKTSRLRLQQSPPTGDQRHAPRPPSLTRSRPASVESEARRASPQGRPTGCQWVFEPCDNTPYRNGHCEKHQLF